MFFRILRRDLSILIEKIGTLLKERTKFDILYSKITPTIICHI